VRLPPLHLVTDDVVLAEPSFAARALAVMKACGGRVAVHVRGRGRTGGELFGRAAELAAGRGEALLLVNDRVDIALAVAADGVHLGGGSLPVAVVRRLWGNERLIGCSVHSPAEAGRVAAEGADFLFLGSIYATGSHPGGATLGPDVLAQAAGPGVPVIAIGGVTPARVAGLLRAGAAGVAVRSGVWDAADAVGAARAYLRALGDVRSEQGT
jgi:thiamine-phosphate diphosphorylase